MRGLRVPKADCFPRGITNSQDWSGHAQTVRNRLRTWAPLAKTLASPALRVRHTTLLLPHEPLPGLAGGKVVEKALPYGAVEAKQHANHRQFFSSVSGHGGFDGIMRSGLS